MAATHDSTAQPGADIIPFATRARPRFRSGQSVRLVTSPVVRAEPTIVSLPPGGAAFAATEWAWFFPEPVQVLPNLSTNVWLESQMEAAEAKPPAQVISLVRLRTPRGTSK